MDDESPVRQVYNQLLQKALEDGVITNDEQAILDKVELEIEAYEKLLDEALKDNIINQDESRQLKKKRAQMLDGAWIVADKDAEINEDEASLLNLLLKLLKNLDLNR